MKICSKCHIEKLESDFYKDKFKKSGIRPSCKVCCGEIAEDWVKRNRRWVRERARIYKVKNLDKIKKQNKANREKHREPVLAHYRQFREENREKLREQYKTLYSVYNVSCIAL